MKISLPESADSNLRAAARLLKIKQAAVWTPNSIDRRKDSTIPTAVLVEVEEKLRQSEARYRALVEWSPEAIAVQRDGKIIYVNPAAIKMMGATSPEDLLGRAIIDLVHPDSREIVLKRLRDATEAGGSLPLIEEKLLKLDGTAIDVEVQGTMITYEGLPAIYGSMRDITQSRAAEYKLRQNRTMLNMASRVGRLGAWAVEVPSLQLTFSDEVKAIHEVAADFVPTVETAIAFYAPECRPVISSAVEACIRAGTPFDLELQFVTARGNPAWVRSIGEAELDGNGAVRRIHGAFQDISERKASELATREQASLIDRANDAIVVRDLDQRIIFWSKGAERIYGWTSLEATGRIVHDLTHPDREIFDAALVTVLRDGTWSGEVRTFNRAGDALTVESRWTLLKDSLDKPKSILTIATDITDKKKLEAQFLRAQRLESIGTLAGGIAHDLNNLLAPIAMGVELLRTYDPNPKMAPIVDTIEKSAARGAALVKQILSFARGVEGSRVTLQVSDIVQEVRSIAENTFPKNITISVTLAKDPWLVLADPTQLNQVLMNLIVNARDAMPEGGRLEMKVCNVDVDPQLAAINRGMPPGRYVLITVVDSGCGMPVEIVDRIFEPFFTTKDIGKGTGLGLSTVAGIVRSHGGYVNVYSELGVGTEFKVYLPALTEADAAIPLGPALSKLPRGNGELILVVDDEASILNITKQTLQAFGYRVVAAEDGAHAIGIYATQRYEIAAVITDMMMPVMDGAALIMALRHIDPHVRVVAASGLTANSSVTRVLGAGVRHFLAKPYSADTLLQTLKSALADERVPAPPG